MHHFHAVVWLDHDEAKIFSLNWHEAQREWRLRDHDRPTHLHHKAGPMSGDGRSSQHEPYYHAIARALAGAGEVLIVGPGTAKDELMSHLKRHDPEIAARIVGLEPVDHPSEAELVAYARKRFRAIDPTRPPQKR